MRVHLIGIGGTGLSAIAQVLLESGIEVSGSDRHSSTLTQRLEAAGAHVYVGHHSENVKQADIVVRSSAVPDDNPEVQAALAMGIPVLKRADFLGQLTAGKQTLAVAGSHGKTTTTAMLATMLTMLGFDPSYIIGGFSFNLNTNAHAGQGPQFIIEADEYDRMFLGLIPWIAVVTNVEHDHPDCYPTPEDFFQAFREFGARLMKNGTLIINADDPGALRLGQEVSITARVRTYGFAARADYLAVDLNPNQAGGFTFTARRNFSEQTGAPVVSAEVNLQVPGKHNVLNALAVLAVADTLGLSWAQCVTALAEFRGTGRRFELRGEVNGVTVIDDYAHHPAEIRATLAAGRARYPDRQIWVVWQPHTYSRTRAFAEEFAAVFGQRDANLVDQLIITQIYAARETEPIDGFSVEVILGQVQNPNLHFIPDLMDVSNYLIAHIQPKDVLIVLSAGDADQISTQVLAGLEQINQSVRSAVPKPEHAGLAQRKN